MNSKIEFYRNLPTKRMASGVLLFNALGELLVVEPNYKSSWEIPGGIIESNESPRAAAIRETEEEIGLTLNPVGLSLVALDYLAGTEDKTEALMFVFSGGMLSPEQQSNIKLRTSELKSFRFVDVTTATALLGPVLGARVVRAINATRSGLVDYFEGRY